MGFAFLGVRFLHFPGPCSSLAGLPNSESSILAAKDELEALRAEEQS